jgi:membrane-associated phospholipid phosphatase
MFELLNKLEFVLGANEAKLQLQGSDLVTLQRPAAAFFESQIPIVASWAELREDRASEIVAQMRPQFPFWAAAVHLDNTQTPHTLQVIELALAFASTISQRFKQAMACPRPIDYSALIQPIISTPAHSCFPSGHATEAYMVAYVLPELLSLDPAERKHYADQLEAQAARISINRTVAGLHFPVDSHAGRVLAKTLSEYFLNFCLQNGKIGVRTAAYLDAKDDFHPDFDLSTNTYFAPQNLYAAVDKSPLSWLWGKALTEWEK